MNKQILVYGLGAGETERYMEALLASSCRTESDIEAVKSAASKDGFHSFRVATWDGSAPNFAHAVRV